MRITAVLVALAVLVAAPAASAKEITKARVCGMDECVTTRDPAILQGLMNGGPPTAPPSTDGAGVISLRATITAPDGTAAARFTSWWVPTLRMLVSEDGTWMRLPASAANAIGRISRDLRPFPGSTIGLASEPAAPKPAPAEKDGGGPGPLLVALAVAVLAAGALLALRRFPRTRDVRAARP